MQSVILSEDDVIALTGLRQPAAQLAELQRQGFHRARRSPTSGRVILERAHYEAVAAGREPPHFYPHLKVSPSLR